MNRNTLVDSSGDHLPAPTALEEAESIKKFLYLIQALTVRLNKCKQAWQNLLRLRQRRQEPVRPETATAAIHASRRITGDCTQTNSVHRYNQ